MAPTFNEMDQIARDAKGNIRKLNRKQLACIQRAGFIDFFFNLEKFYSTKYLKHIIKATKETEIKIAQGSALRKHKLLLSDPH